MNGAVINRVRRGLEAEGCPILTRRGLEGNIKGVLLGQGGGGGGGGFKR